MSKGERTRQRILEAAAELISVQGYQGASYSALMEATGLQKGGIYNHFQNKDELAIAAFDYAIELARQRSRDILHGRRHTIDRLRGVVEVFCAVVENPYLTGGCILLNTAIEADDAYPPLKARAQAVMQEWLDYIRITVDKGIQRGEIQPDVDGASLASQMMSTLEGAIMLTKLYDDLNHMHHAACFVLTYLDRIQRS